MDRPVTSDIVRARRRRRTLQVAGSVAGCVLLALAVRALLAPSVKRNTLRTARVERGAVEATLSASGIVVPLIEHVIASPIDTRVLRVHKAPGASVAPGEPIVELDVGPARLAVETLDDEIALKRNEQARIRLDLETTLADTERSRRIKQLELQSLQYTATQHRRLFELGILTDDAARKAETDVAKAQIELAQLTDAMAAAGKSHAARDQGLTLEMTILAKRRAEAARVLRAATAVADRAGVLTYVVTAEGSAVRTGDVLARVADLSAFRIDATVSDVHAGRITAGLPALVRLGDSTLTGTVHTVHPAVENGALTFEVALDRASDPRLRPSLRVEVQAVTAIKPHVLRLARGTYDTPDGSQCAFIVRGNHAVRTRIRLGLASFESFEVVEGLKEGDEVIISDTSSFMHHPEVGLR